jgi:hypothetical protein
MNRMYFSNRLYSQHNESSYNPAAVHRHAMVLERKWYLPFISNLTLT